MSYVAGKLSGFREIHFILSDNVLQYQFFGPRGVYRVPSSYYRLIIDSIVGHLENSRGPVFKSSRRAEAILPQRVKPETQHVCSHGNASVKFTILFKFLS